MASAAGSGGGAGAGAGGLKTYFKTPEGRHKLQYEKTHSPAVVHYNHSGKTVSQVATAPSFGVRVARGVRCAVLWGYRWVALCWMDGELDGRVGLGWDRMWV